MLRWLVGLVMIALGAVASFADGATVAATPGVPEARPPHPLPRPTMPDSGSSMSRRESLKRAAGALALGLGAPAALAADGSPRFTYYKLGFHKVGTVVDGQIEIPDVIAEQLLGPDGQIDLSGVRFTHTETGETQDFRVRRAR